MADRQRLLINYISRTRDRGRGCEGHMSQAIVNQTFDFWDKCDVLILDEAHELRKQILFSARLHNVTVVGMTATPFTKGLQSFYGPIVSGPTTNDMIRRGRLVHPRVVDEPWYGEYRIAFEQVKLRGQTLAFVPAKDLTAALQTCKAAGYASAAIRSGMPSETIERTVKAFEEGRMQVILSIAMLSRDYDNPAVRHALDFVKQTSFGHHVQKLNRIMWAAPGKYGLARYHDFTGNWKRFREARDQFWEHGVRDWANVACYQV